MLVALSGTPGTGKSSATLLLQQKGYHIVSLNKLAFNKRFIVGVDKKRNSKIIDIIRLNSYLDKHYKTEDIVIIEGHLAHLLRSVDKVILLRCHPKQLKMRLKEKGWDQNKIKENVEAETIDVILCEAVEIHQVENIFEIDTTHTKKEDVTSAIIEIIKSDFQPTKKYNIGKIDWSEEILDDY
jgi:adenylate kinase